MERSTSLLSFSSRSSSHASTSRNHEPLLPYTENVLEKKPIRIQSFLAHCLYRRILIWTIASLVLVSIFLFTTSDASVPEVVSSHFSAPKSTSAVATPPPQATSSEGDNGEGSDTVLVIVDAESQKGKDGEQDPEDKIEEAKEKEETKEEEKEPPQEEKEGVKEGEKDESKEDESKEEKEKPKQGKEEDQDELSAEEDDKARKKVEEAKKKEEDNLKKMPWLQFPHLDGYFHGLKALVEKSEHIAEYPNPNRQAPLAEPPLKQNIPRPRLYSPYNSSDSKIRTCYLDSHRKIPAPSIYAYPGVPQHMPDPSFGSYGLLGIRDDVCFDRFGRYGPYGLGYKMVDGGSGAGMDTEDSGSAEVWAETGQINYGQVDWGDAQERCLAANEDRFVEPDLETEELKPVEGKKSRIAVVIRLYTGFKWTQLAVLNFRALITEVSLKSGGEYAVHFLLHVKDGEVPIWADDVTVQRLLDANVPTEFHGLVTLWSEPQMRLLYPGKFPDPISNPSRTDLHGVYRSAHLPLQIFAKEHPEYEHFWNWEMDMRYLGNWYELFDRMGRWAGEQPRSLLWERSARYYIPSYHGSWENFTVSVEQATMDSGKDAIFGPVDFAGRRPLRNEQQSKSPVPDSCAVRHSSRQCGVGEPADLITLNPIFDVQGSGWVFSNDATGYGDNREPPRRCAIITASRLSRRLLAAMHEEVWRHHHTMFTEMFPASVALHHGFKAVYAPHPVFLDRAWDALGGAVDAAFNGGQDHSTSGKGSPFDLRNEHNHKGTSWYYNSEFAGLLWRRWLGYAQMDGRGQNGGKIGQGTSRGGKEAEEGETSSGRMCLRSMLVHPIKHENPGDK